MEHPKSLKNQCDIIKHEDLKENLILEGDEYEANHPNLIIEPQLLPMVSRRTRS